MYPWGQPEAYIGSKGVFAYLGQQPLARQHQNRNIIISAVFRHRNIYASNRSGSRKPAVPVLNSLSCLISAKDYASAILRSFTTSTDSGTELKTSVTMIFYQSQATRIQFYAVEKLHCVINHIAILQNWIFQLQVLILFKYFLFLSKNCSFRHHRNMNQCEYI